MWLPPSLLHKRTFKKKLDVTDVTGPHRVILGLILGLILEKLKIL